MTMSPIMDEPRKASCRAPHPSAGRGDREALLNLYDALDPARGAELLRHALSMVRQADGMSRTPSGAGGAG